MKRFRPRVASACIVALCALNAGEAAEQARAVVSGSYAYLNAERTTYFKVEGWALGSGQYEPITARR
jgi:hypothetical protein